MGISSDIASSSETMGRDVDADLATLALHQRGMYKEKGKAGEYSTSSENVTILKPC